MIKNSKFSFDDADDFFTEDEPKQSQAKEVKYCKSCKAENSISAKFCSECGSKEFVSKVSNNVKYCVCCKEEVSANAKFCQYCGGNQFVNDLEELEDLNEQAKYKEYYDIIEAKKKTIIDLEDKVFELKSEIKSLEIELEFETFELTSEVSDDVIEAKRIMIEDKEEEKTRCDEEAYNLVIEHQKYCSDYERRDFDLDKEIAICKKEITKLKSQLEESKK